MAKYKNLLSLKGHEPFPEGEEKIGDKGTYTLLVARLERMTYSRRVGIIVSSIAHLLLMIPLILLFFKMAAGYLDNILDTDAFHNLVNTVLISLIVFLFGPIILGIIASLLTKLLLCVFKWGCQRGIRGKTWPERGQYLFNRFDKRIRFGYFDYNYPLKFPLMSLSMAVGFVASIVGIVLNLSLTHIAGKIIVVLLVVLIATVLLKLYQKPWRFISRKTEIIYGDSYKSLLEFWEYFDAVMRARMIKKRENEKKESERKQKEKEEMRRTFAAAYIRDQNELKAKREAYSNEDWIITNHIDLSDM